MGDDSTVLAAQVQQGISIHVPRMGDDGVHLAADCVTPISIHVPRMGDDLPASD